MQWRMGALSFAVVLFALSSAAFAGQIIYVDDDGPADFNNIQAAVNDSNDGDIIEVQPGTYIGDGNRDIDFRGLTITVRSTDPNDPNIVAATIIDCQGSEAEPHRGFYFHSGEDANSVLDGFTITNGYGPKKQIVIHSKPRNASIGGAIFCDDSNLTIRNCIMTGNSAGWGGGMFNYVSSPILTNCTFSGNSPEWNGGGMFNLNSSPTLADCIFSGNSGQYGGGMYNRYSSPELTDCTFSENFAEGVGGGIYNAASSPALTNCMFTKNSADGHGGGGMINVGKSSPMLTGCMFIGNSAYWYGGGMYNFDSSPTLTNCTFSQNSAYHYGGGLLNRYSSPSLINCIFTENSAGWRGGGGMFNWDSSPSLINCVFTRNSATNGGGMYNEESSPTLDYCKLTRNSANMYGGGIYNAASSPALTNCTITGNSANNRSGGMHNSASSPTLTNCTITGNLARWYSGGIYNYDSNPTLVNCILWGDMPREMYVFRGNPQVRYSDIQGGWPGQGNIDDDPLFVDPGYWEDPCSTPDDPFDDVWVEGDYHLQPGSPCIDAGDNSVVEPNSSDLAGNPRIIDGDEDGEAIVDMGAYEFLPSIEADLRILPRVINRKSRGRYVLAIMRLPEGIAEEDIDADEGFVLEPGNIESILWRTAVYDEQVRVFVLFEKARLMDAVSSNGEIELTVSGQLESGQGIYGVDTIRIIGPPQEHPRGRGRPRPQGRAGGRVR